MDYDELEEIYGGGLCRGFAEWQVTEQFDDCGYALKTRKEKCLRQYRKCG
jgi:hypothetical protein